MTTCTHLDTITVTELPEEVAGCEDCLRDRRRLAAPAHLPRVRPRRLLRRLAQPARDRSAEASGHPLIRSLEPGEDWSWCFIDEVGMLIPEVSGHTRIPPSPMLAG